MNPGMINKLQKMQKDMVKDQKQIEESEFYGTAAGVVEVIAKGNKTIVSIKISEGVLEDKDDLEMIQDTITAAVNDVMKKIDRETEEVMGKYSQGMGGMGGLF